MLRTQIISKNKFSSCANTFRLWYNLCNFFNNKSEREQAFSSLTSLSSMDKIIEIKSLNSGKIIFNRFDFIISLFSSHTNLSSDLIKHCIYPYLFETCENTYEINNRLFKDSNNLIIYKPNNGSKYSRTASTWKLNSFFLSDNIFTNKIRGEFKTKPKFLREKSSFKNKKKPTTIQREGRENRPVPNPRGSCSTVNCLGKTTKGFPHCYKCWKQEKNRPLRSGTGLFLIPLSQKLNN